MTALSAPPIALACRRRPLDLARARSSESMAAPLAMSELVGRISMCVIELAEHGAHAAPGDFVLGHLAEKNKARSSRASATWTGSMTWSSGARRSTTVMSEASCSGSGVFCSYGRRCLSGERAERGESPPSSSPRAITSTMAPRSLLSLQLEPPSPRGSRTSVTSSGKGLAT
jgi:hypothetical protein